MISLICGIKKKNLPQTPKTQTHSKRDQLCGCQRWGQKWGNQMKVVKWYELPFMTGMCTPGDVMRTVLAIVNTAV